MRFASIAEKLVGLAVTLNRWVHMLAALDAERRERVAIYAEKIAATLDRATLALRKFEAAPDDTNARLEAIKELARIAGYAETIIAALDQHLDGRKVAGVKRRLEQLRPDGIRRAIALRRPISRIDRLVAAEGYFRAMADGLRT